MNAHGLNPLPNSRYNNKTPAEKQLLSAGANFLTDRYTKNNYFTS